MKILFVIHYRVFGGAHNRALRRASILERGGQTDPARARIAGHTPERWAEEFERAVDTILSGDRVGKGT